ncbi:ribonuclease E/G [Radiobacillus kanasensis]|uniref:ribonuclease E/G n=1 Tax=Radiobacillus kanasensis TaxID=2844358 RepID=UPI001E41BC3E|nr:ribonuclease E/G [Radiobacillus kanasensis]UFT97915.1 ribonuclease E/G [Radiobacillus kanasensis]
MASIYLYMQGTEQIGILAEKSDVQEVQIVRPEAVSRVGNIYLGKVVNIETSLQAAFVDFGGGKFGFLPKKEVPEARVDGDRPLESLLTEGQRIIVQVVKDAYQQKGAQLTANITVPGIHVVYLPFGNYVAVSRKLSEEQREAWKKEGNRWVTDCEGAIIRTSSQSADKASLQAEWQQLRHQWKNIEKTAQNGPVPSSLFMEFPLSKWIRKFRPNELESIFVNQVQAANQLKKELPSHEALIHWQKQLPLSVPLDHLLESILSPKVSTTEGVELWIEQTEALTVVDVNSSTFRKGWTKEDAVFLTNKVAAIEIAKQLRLRNISGIIMIDFIKMKSTSNQQKLLHIFQTALKKDAIRTEVYGFTKLGLLEMTRKREAESLPSILGGTFRDFKTFSSETYAFLLERELLERKEEALIVDVHPQVLQFFKEKIMPNSVGQVHIAVFMKENENVNGFNIIRSGSQETINEYIAAIPSDAIDKVF